MPARRAAAAVHHRQEPFPDRPYRLFNPGPVNVHPDVRRALDYPDLCHREPEVARMMRAVRAKAAAVAGGDDEWTSVLLTGSGTAALEAAIASVVPDTGRLLVLDNGNYGERMYRIATANRVPVRRLEFGWENPVDLAAVGRVLDADPQVTHLAVVHHETSTGMLNPLRPLGELAHARGLGLLVDAISSVGAEPLDVLADHVDWCVGTANKCLESLPGVSFVAAPHRRLRELADIPPRGYYLDLGAHYRSQEDLDAPLFTPAVQVLAAFEAALDLTLAEGVEARARRCAALTAQLREGMSALGLELRLPAAHRSGTVTNVRLPAGMAYADLHDALKAEGFLIYGVQQQLGSLFRVATMGRLTADDVRDFLRALGDRLRRPDTP